MIVNDIYPSIGIQLVKLQNKTKKKKKQKTKAQNETSPRQPTRDFETARKETPLGDRREPRPNRSASIEHVRLSEAILLALILLANIHN